MTYSTGKQQFRKIALILSNGDYSRPEDRLQNVGADANSFSNVLKQIGFQVTTVCNKGKHDMATAIIDFANTIQDGDLVLFYYFGHCYRVKDKHYLIPASDGMIEQRTDVADFSVDLERNLERFVEKNTSFVNIFILDSCGTYSLQSSATLGAANGSENLPRLTKIDGLFIQCACGTNESTRNNLFTKHLLNNVQEENVSIRDLFRQITKDVEKESNNKQRPLVLNGLRRHDDICLNEVERQKWADLDDSEIPALLKKQEEQRDCYDNYPNLDDVINRNTPDMQKADELTDSLLNKQPSGNPADKHTLYHALSNLMESNNQQCVFFDSRDDVKLHDASANLADLGTEDKPLILKLNSNKQFIDYRDSKDEHFDLRVIKTLEQAIEHNDSHPILDDIVSKLANAHGIQKNDITLSAVYVGSFNIVYTVKHLAQKAIKKLADLSKKLKEQFKDFVAAKIHPLLFRPSFDIAQFDECGDRAFTSPEKHQVGPVGRTKEYTSPVGYTRYGLKVLGKYADDQWLHPFGSPQNWYRAFHGTKNAKPIDGGDPNSAAVDVTSIIHKSGFTKATNALHGPGVYCSPIPNFVENGYAGEVKLDTTDGSKKFKMMLQVAVNPDDVKFTSDANIWVVKHPENIRAYGILIKEV
ncbi:unnamed protein product [Adineta ricciae]|uniref:Caspase family p20 domain-containing protein n=1 Tax=Adineta ricciae TaxID=249248 RepID=A0A814PI02_ADIRI|nr:unnamed protein product [Adineta ricciae]